MHYEDVVASPREQVSTIMAHADEPVDDGMLAFLRPGEANLGVNHTVAGSLMRLRRGPLRVREDDEWRHALRPGHRRAATLLSWPLPAAYGYVARNGAPSRRAVTP